MTTVKFRGSSRTIQVGQILCLGRNYAEHAKEMHADVPAVPVVFLKPSTAVVHDGENVILPPFSNQLHHEVEMVVVIGKKGKDVSPGRAYEYVAGYAVGLDMTLRDLQDEAKQKGLPWAVSKGFDTAAPLSPVVERDLIEDPHSLDISLKVNGSIRQRSNTGRMIFQVHDVLAYLSSVFTLEPGDLVFTGTPEGVGSVVPGDILEATLEKVGTLRVGIQQKLAHNLS